MKLLPASLSSVGGGGVVCRRALTRRDEPELNREREKRSQCFRVAVGSGRRAVSGFTMIEIAICLAIIGVALVGIIGVLPVGMNTQRANREETVIGQDANVLIELLRNGSRGADDLTNYVYAITNSWVQYDNLGNFKASGVNGYNYQAGYEYGSIVPSRGLYCGTNIIGLLSTPEFTFVNPDNSIQAVPNVCYGGYSNHVVAYVRSISGLAAEKPPQDNQILIDDTFSYHIYVVNAPLAVDTNLFSPWWSSANSYNNGNYVLYNWYCWQALANFSAGGTPPPNTANWVRISYYPLEVGRRQHDLRMTFLWPQLPNGNVGGYRHSFRTTIAGDLQPDLGNGLFFYQPKTFTATP